MISLYDRDKKNISDSFKIVVGRAKQLEKTLDENRQTIRRLNVPDLRNLATVGLRVSDENGNPLPNVHVTFINEDPAEKGKTRIEATLGDDGNGSVLLHRGAYIVFIEAQDFDSYKTKIDASSGAAWLSADLRCSRTPSHSSPAQ